ncbi:UNVERIFIED_CONTAM: hypothetical protein HDU68_011402 [Siphonaria sp. JEL0065]|nr:hypothetical protein HDU68_011402 [Siphonaria sp. JEL0065]
MSTKGRIRPGDLLKLGRRSGSFSSIGSATSRGSHDDSIELQNVQTNTFIGQPFASANCASFGVFRPDRDQSLSELYTQYEYWSPVDLLILPLHDLVVMAKEDRDGYAFSRTGSGISISLKTSSNAMLQRDSSVTNLTSYSHLPLMPPDRAFSASSPPPPPPSMTREPSGNFSRSASKAGSRSSVHSGKRPKSSRIKSFLGMMDVRKGSLGNFEGNDDDNSPMNYLRQVLISRTKYQIAEVDVLSLYKLYIAKRATLGLMTFAMFMLQEITEDFTALGMAMSGFFFNNCVAVYEQFPGLEVALAALFKALRETWIFTESPVVLLLDEFGMDCLDHLRDNLNGLVLSNVLLDFDGNVRIRENADRAIFEKQIKALKMEISMRKDFSVFSVECVESVVSFHVLNHAIKFFIGNNFKFWISKTVGMNSVFDIAPTKHLVVSTDMLEISTAVSVLSLQKLAEQTYTDLVDNGYLNHEISPAHLHRIITTLKPSSDFWKIHHALFSGLRAQDFAPALYQRVPFPESPSIGQLDPSINTAITNLLDSITHQPHLSFSSSSKKQGIQHTHFGVTTNPSRQSRLGDLVLKVLWDLKSKNLLAAARYNLDLGSDTENYAPMFVNMIALLEGLTNAETATPAAKWVLSLLDGETQLQAVLAIRMLLDGLKKDVVRVWLGTKVAFIPKDKAAKEGEAVDYDPIWALTDERDEQLFIFVSDGHPCLEEAVLHSFLKHRGFKRGVCGVLEALVSAQKNKNPEFNIPVPLRIVHEIKAAYRSKLLSFVRNSGDVIQSIEKNAITNGEAEYLKNVALYVNKCVEYILVTQEAFTDTMKTMLEKEYAPSNLAEEELVEYFGKQTRPEHGLNTVNHMCAGLEKLLRQFVVSGERDLSYVLCCLAFTIRKAFRRCAYLELELAITDMSTQILPEKDQVAVCLEMATTQTTLQEIFCLSSIQLAPAFHAVQRAKLMHEDHNNAMEEEDLFLNPEDDQYKNADFGMGRLIANSYIYIYPILVDIVLNAILANGLFSSNRMDSETVQASSIAFLVSFPFVGALMNSFGRTMSFYFYQMSISVMIAAVSHRLVASISFLIFVGLLVSLCIFVLVTHDWVLIAMGFVYPMIFGLYMIMYAVLVAFRDPAVAFYKSPGPLTCAQSIIFLILPPLIAKFAFQDESHSKIVWAIYLGNMALTVCFMFYRYGSISREFLEWPSKIKITSKDYILKVYDGVVKKPVKEDDNEAPEETDRKLRLWERGASDWFSDRLEYALKNPVLGMDERIKERIRQFKWERPLMAWFMQRSAVAPSTIKTFSAEWDALAKQAVETLSRKYQVDKLNRGALLFQLESPAIVFGFLYFVIIFIDKFAALIATGTVSINISNLSTEGIAFATIYLLLASGFLELTILACSERINQFKYSSAASVENPQSLISQYQEYTDNIYRTELKKFALRAFFILSFVSGIVGVRAYLTDSVYSVFWTYGIACANFTGLLVGLFNKMFVTTDEHLLNKFLAGSIFAGLVISSTLIRVLKDERYVLLATGLGCWGFAICCLVVRFHERVRSPYYDISIGPNLRTSGQRQIGFSSNVFTRNQRETYAKQLLTQRDDFKLYSPTSATGLDCLALLENAISKVPKIDLLNGTSEDLIHLLKTSIGRYNRGTVIVRETPGPLVAGGISYSAIAVKPEGLEDIEIFVANMIGLDATQKATILCESIVHEVAESLGWSHSRACVMEVLIQSAWNESFEIPRRVQRELDDATGTHCDRIVSNTEANMSRFAAFGVDVNKYWTRDHFTSEERMFLLSVAKEWNVLVSNGFDSATTKQRVLEICNSAPTTLNPKLQSILYKSRNQHSQLNVVMEHCLLMSMATSRIAVYAANAVGDNVSPQFPRTMIGRSALRQLSDNINVFFATYYFALTCDTSFSREVALLPSFARIPLCLLHTVNQAIFDQINQTLLFRRSKVVVDFQRRSELGVTRVHRYENSTLARIDVLEGAEVIYTTTVAPSDKGSEISDDKNFSTFVELKRYSGERPVGWTPQAKDKAVALALVRRTRDAIQIIHEKFLNDNGVVRKMHLYDFSRENQKYPISRSVFDYDVGSGVIKTDRDVLETHHFYTSGNLLGLVHYAELRRIHKFTNEQVTITVEFGYNLPLITKTPSWAIFRRADCPKWKVSVEYAPFSDSEAPLQPWKVRYCDGVSGTVLSIKYDYSHPKHPVTRTVLESVQTANTSLVIDSEEEEIPSPPEIIDDHFGIMQLIPFKSVFDSCELMTRELNPLRHYEFRRGIPFLGLTSVEYCSTPYVTRRRRDILWASWRAGKIPGVFARILDQNILRKEPALHQYWIYRFTGRAEQAVHFLEDNRDHLNNVLYVADRPATRTRLQIRFSDLLIMSNGGDSEKISSFDQLSGKDSSDTLEAICLDSGTWPTGGGGVGSCRRDVVDSLASVRWTAIAEIAEQELEKKDYQIERNIKSITYLPIFDNDMGSPMENFYKTTAFGDLRIRANKTTDVVVATIFVPLVRQLIDACMTEDLHNERIQQDEHTIVSLYKYFRVYDWKMSWNHPLTQKAWMSLLLQKAKDMENAGVLTKQESPTLAHISMLFTLFSRLLLILSKEIPDIPVVHVSHHGTQSLIAVISKVIHGSSVIIWDHGMLWRERLFALCRDGMPPFTQIGFIGLTRVCTRLAYHRADYVTPCTNIQNVMWAAHLAGGKYLNDFERTGLISKCSAVLNGMNLKKFSIRRELARKTPTAVMLSHVSPLKDVMNAIKAAYYIVHEFKLTSYQLHIYGSLEVDMAYTVACKMAIKDLNIESNVILKGLGNPTLVLPTGWIFVNSSITEGLPLAIGEAGLCGLPVVCTNVGGSLEVISDMKTGALYGAIVPPSRSRQLALGQLQVFSMTGGLDTFVDPKFADSSLTIQELIAQGPEALEERIMDPKIGSMRERLGSLFGLKTQSVFSITRYWREHEQVLWLGELYSRKC